MMKRFAFLSAMLISALSWAQKEIQVENFYDGTFSQERVRSLNWMNDGLYYSELSGNNVIKNRVTDASTVATLVNGDSLGINIDDYTFSSDESKVLLMTERESIYRRSFTAEYYMYDMKNKVFSKLSENGPQSYATFSPDGKQVAFTRDNNIFTVRLDNMNEEQITKDGKFNSIINGSSDWVYEEEFSITKAFFWSPDSKKIAYIKFDESAVREYNMQTWNDGALYPEDYKFKYPKAGESNSIVNVYFHDIKENKKTKVDLGKETDIYVPRIQWTKNPNTLSIIKLNRLQNRLDIIHADARNGSTDLVYTDKSKTYIDITYTDDLTYLNNGTQFIYSSEKDGYKHFYLHSMDGQLVNQITKGKWDAVSMVALDQSKKTPVLYYISTEDSPMERHLYRVSGNGKGKVKMSLEPGWNSADMSNDAKYYVLSNSSATSPLKVSLFQNKGNKLVKVLKDNSALKERVKDFQLADKKFFSFETVDQWELNGYFLLPNEFDSTKTYPVFLYQYSGPGSQNVTNSWAGRHYYYHQMLTQKGYIVAVVDNRGTGGRGTEFKNMTYKQLGKLETEDHIEAAKFFQTLPFVDDDRIGIWGWSYGGYMSSLVMMKGAKYFKAGVAVAPVTTWRYYDTIYTERYLQRPQDNPEGYDDNSPNTHVDKLEGKLLLIHGTGDDNVHFQNAVALQNELIKNGKQFQSFYYPDKAHSIGGLATRHHLYKMMANFVLENL